MTTEASPVAVDAVDELQKKFTAAKIEEEIAAEEKEPKSSGSTPEARTPAQNLSEDGRRIMFVAKKSNVKSVAGSVARTIREEKFEKMPILSAVGAASVNQAVKSIAIARDFVKAEEYEVGVDVSREPQAEVRDVMMFSLTKHVKNSLLKKDDENKENKDEEGEMYHDLRAASNGAPSGLAGAIAMSVRAGKIARITAIGQMPVFKAVSGITLARRYLKKDNVDIIMVPRFTEVKFENGKDVNAMQLLAIPKSTAAE